MFVHAPTFDDSHDDTSVMPEYFFHVCIELLPDSLLHQSQQRASREPWSDGRRALSPFLKHAIPPNHKKSLDSQQASSARPRDIDVNQGANASPGAQLNSLLQVIPSDPDDQRIDHIFLESMDMNSVKPLDQTESIRAEEIHVSRGIGTSISSMQTKGRYVPLDQQTSESIWGIVHLYRDAEETPGLYGDSPLSKPSNPWYSGTIPRDKKVSTHPPPSDQDCTTLCILAVPSYLAPSDFLGFVGEDTRNEVSHFRMIRTTRANRYMVLMKFRSGKKAMKWQQEWNGKVFNSMEPETCHVVFLKSVEITPNRSSGSSSPLPPTFPTVNNDPFNSPPPSSIPLASSKLTTTKPLAPRTPSLIELPTCPVCLERMDETTGLLTILCQHVFHCTCLEKWSGGGCPVCRYTHDDFSTRRAGLGSSLKSKSGKKMGGLHESDSYKGDGWEDSPLECETCHAEANLWQCLICGKVGCGRYDAKHAFTHYTATGHSFSMDMESKRVWDYGGDGYVHRIIQDAGDGVGGKLIELPGPRSRIEGTTALEEGGEEEQGVKMEGLALEYTHLLTSQLESQRVYFEEKVERAADKASEAAASAAAAMVTAEKVVARYESLQSKYDDLAQGAVPALEKEKGRAEKRAERFEEMARKMEKEYREEKAINSRLMERIEHLSKQVETLQLTKTDLEEQNRDLTFFISSSEKLKEAGEDVQEGTISVPDPAVAGGKKKFKGKGKR